jgi:hypothetical protein
MDGNKIEIGDIVDVTFETQNMICNAEVLYTPCATGDSWHLRVTDIDGFKHIFYVQQFTTMGLIKKAESIF